MQCFDGAAQPNPGPSGCGAAIFDAQGFGFTDDDAIAKDSAFLGWSTNNQAEYEGLILGLQLALDNGAQQVSIRGDSELVVKQVLGEWRVRFACQFKDASWPLAKQLTALPGHNLLRVDDAYGPRSAPSVDMQLGPVSCSAARVQVHSSTLSWLRDRVNGLTESTACCRASTAGKRSMSTETTTLWQTGWPKKLCRMARRAIWR